eukprot:65818-Prymnesium_polylepis.1
MVVLVPCVSVVESRIVRIARRMYAECVRNACAAHRAAVAMSHTGQPTPPPSTPPHPMGCWAGVVDIPDSCSHRAELAFVRIFAKCEIRKFECSRACRARTRARRTGCITTGQTKGCVAHSTPPPN